MPRLRGADYAQVHGLSRGLSVLRALNSAEGGLATASELSKETKLHRTTVRRLVETLIGEGYVRRSESDDSFRLTLKIRELSEGFTDDEWIAQTAASALSELLRRVVWPTDLTTLDGDAMVIRETTHRLSPLSFHRSMVQRRLPLLYTAAGRAYLAFCPPEERQQLLSVVLASDNQKSLARERTIVDNILERARRDGYAANDGDWQQESHVGAIAVPIRRGERVLGCVNVVFLRRALTTNEAAERFYPILREVIGKLEASLVKTSSA